jgi:hypothetical protein
VILALLATSSVADAAKPVVSSVASVSEGKVGAPQGPTAGGTEVQLEGQNLGQCELRPLSGPERGEEEPLGCQRALVYFGTEPGIVLKASETTLDVVSPAHEPGNVDVTVTTPTGSSSSTAADHYAYEGAALPPPTGSLPVITQISPENGPYTGFTDTLIKGEHLLPEGVESCVACAGAVARFGETAVPVLAGAQHEIEVVAPPHALGVLPVRVTTTAGTSAAFGHFSFVPPPPRVTVTSPANGSVIATNALVIAGEAGAEAGDLPTVYVTLFEGASLGMPLETHVVESSGGHWSSAFAALGPGTYTVRAEQLGESGNLGLSAPVTFTVDPPEALIAPPPGGGIPGDAPPSAAFTWYPQSPRTDEPVSLVSSSSDAQSAITGFAWALAGGGPFQAGGPFLTTSFASAGGHVVRLRVTSADGLSNVASRTIVVGSVEPGLMQPFPVVRIAGTDGSFGVKLELLTVQAPAGARITIRCRGRRCPVKKASRTAPSRGHGLATVTFRQFDRTLSAGVTLIVRVYKPGEIGKYTRFVVRSGKLPKRTDTCLDAAGIKPMACPSS